MTKQQQKFMTLNNQKFVKIIIIIILFLIINIIELKF
jgi:hypothetical protein